MKNVLLLVLVSFFSLELFSFVASKSNLLLFNDVPAIYRTQYPADDWRTQKEPWGAWHKPNALDRHQIPNCFDVRYRSNEIGARDTSFRQKKAGSEERYILLGDSFAEGYGVNFEDTAKAQLEKLLGIDVYNFGSAGYFGPVQYYLTYKKLASHYQHDGVILFFLPANDFTDNDYSLWKNFHPTWYRPYYAKRGDGQYDIFYPEQAIPSEHFRDEVRVGLIKGFLIRYTFTANALRTVHYLLARSDIEKLGYAGYYDATPEEQEAAIYFVKKIVMEAIPKRVIIFIIPSEEDLARIHSGHAYRDQYWFRELHSLQLLNPSVDVIDMAKEMPSDYKQFFLSCNSHWNESGNLLAAKIIAARFQKFN